MKFKRFCIAKETINRAKSTGAAHCTSDKGLTSTINRELKKQTLKNAVNKWVNKQTDSSQQRNTNSL